MPLSTETPKVVALESDIVIKEIDKYSCIKFWQFDYDDNQ